MKRTILLIMAATFIAACSPTPKDVAASKIDSIFSELFPSDEPGAAVLVLQGDEIILDKGYGIADLESGAAIDGNTFFNIASVSKQFTAVAVLQLAEQGKLSLEDNVKSYFPEYKADFYEKIQIKHLLSHSSGIPDARDRSDKERNLIATEEIVMQYLPDLDFLHFEPGTEYEYINPTFLVVASIVEKVSGMPFVEYVKENIFIPAGMEQTLFFEADKEDLIPNMAHGYEYEDVSNMPEERTASEIDKETKKEWYEYDYGEVNFFATKADGGMYTSTHEFILWEKALRNHTVLGKEMLNAAHTPQIKVSGSKFSSYQNRPNTWYGYGWFIEPATETSPLKIYHTGDNGGFKILAARYPESETLVLVFANRADLNRYAVMQQIEEALGL
ncbi:MAG TPA: serine hydrolase [Bacteroidales bacterium]|nr:serine hydrolase [Bacteroidales bacterium]